jgi:hypothetical protein
MNPINLIIIPFADQLVDHLPPSPSGDMGAFSFKGYLSS